MCHRPSPHRPCRKCAAGHCISGGQGIVSSLNFGNPQPVADLVGQSVAAGRVWVEERDARELVEGYHTSIELDRPPRLQSTNSACDKMTKLERTDQPTKRRRVGIRDLFNYEDVDDLERDPAPVRAAHHHSLLQLVIVTRKLSKGELVGEARREFKRGRLPLAVSTAWPTGECDAHGNVPRSAKLGDGDVEECFRDKIIVRKAAGAL